MKAYTQISVRTLLILFQHLLRIQQEICLVVYFEEKFALKSDILIKAEELTHAKQALRGTLEAANKVLY
jgi:hypothetical protein